MLNAAAGLLVVQDLDGNFRNAAGKGPHVATLRQIGNALTEFLSAAAAYRSEHCRLPRIWRAGSQGQGSTGHAVGPGGEAPGAGAAAAAAAGAGEGVGDGEGGKADAGPKQEQQAERPPLKRPACFRWVWVVFRFRRG